MLNIFEGGPIEGYRFSPLDLNIAGRTPGISAFMRIRNGAAFLEATIRSHIDFFDEIVAVHNQCTDETATILARLAQEFGPRLRVYHYLDRVFPQGTQGHIATPGDAPQSVVNYSNCALSLTRHQFVTKLDDDHLAIPNAVESVAKMIRNGYGNDTPSMRHTSEVDTRMMCFSGLNLARDNNGRLSVPAVEPVSGGGDIGFFRVSEDTHFFHDPRFERFSAGKLRRTFAGYLYWHLKYLKPGTGFANYELDQNPNSRFKKKQQVFLSNSLFAGTMEDVRHLLPANPLDRLAGLLNKKRRLIFERNGELLSTFGDGNIEDIVKAHSDTACFALAFDGMRAP